MKKVKEVETENQELNKTNPLWTCDDDNGNEFKKKVKEVEAENQELNKTKPLLTHDDDEVSDAGGNGVNYDDDEEVKDDGGDDGDDDNDNDNNEKSQKDIRPYIQCILIMEDLVPSTSFKTFVNSEDLPLTISCATILMIFRCAHH